MIITKRILRLLFLTVICIVGCSKNTIEEEDAILSIVNGTGPDGNLLNIQWSNEYGSGDLYIAHEGEFIEEIEFANGTVIDDYSLV